MNLLPAFSPIGGFEDFPVAQTVYGCWRDRINRQHVAAIRQIAVCRIPMLAAFGAFDNALVSGSVDGRGRLRIDGHKGRIVKTADSLPARRRIDGPEQTSLGGYRIKRRRRRGIDGQNGYSKE